MNPLTKYGRGRVTVDQERRRANVTPRALSTAVTMGLYSRGELAATLDVMQVVRLARHSISFL